VKDGVRVGERSLAHSAHSLASGRALAILLVGGEVERDEEEEVRAEDTNTREGSELLTRALPGVGEPRPVGRNEVGVRSEVNEAQVNDELDDLETGDPLLPPNADATRALEVVPVHNDVHSQVQGNDNPRDRG